MPENGLPCVPTDSCHGRQPSFWAMPIRSVARKSAPAITAATKSFFIALTVAPGAAGFHPSQSTRSGRERGVGQVAGRSEHGDPVRSREQLDHPIALVLLPRTGPEACHGPEEALVEID